MQGTPPHRSTSRDHRSTGIVDLGNGWSAQVACETCEEMADPDEQPCTCGLHLYLCERCGLNLYSECECPESDHDD